MKILRFILVFLLIVVGASLWYVSDYYHGEDVIKYLISDDQVEVTTNEHGYYFDGFGTENAIVFYQGAKVEAEAYAPLMYELSKNGIDCILVDMPFNLAFFGKDIAGKLMEQYEYENWYLAGHSFGGAIGSMYVKEQIDSFAGIILLASYATEDFTNDNIRVLSIYGDKDGVLNLDNLIEARSLMPKNYKEVVIEGGNHAQFGSYGFQESDLEAMISASEQLQITVDNIIEFIIGK